MTEREIETVAGTVSGILEKGAGKWQVLVRPDGSQYDKKLWTKAAQIHERASALIGSRASFQCVASYWDNNGTQVRSLWIDAIGGDSAVPQTHSDAAGAVSAPQSSPGPSSRPVIDPTRTSIERQTALGRAVDLISATPAEWPKAMELTDVVLAVAARFAAFLASGETTTGHRASGGYPDTPSFHDPAPDEDIPFRWVDRWEVQ